MNNDILVSIVMITYNHEKYIRESLESVLTQEVNFVYEIIIGDDASTDSTQILLQEYQYQYPDRIRLILREENIGPTNNFYDTLMHARGKYIATLEGDDFWTDENKLMIQTEFLEKNQNYAGITHSCNIFDQNSQRLIKRGCYLCKKNHDYGFEDFKYTQLPGHTSTMVFKNIFLDRTKDYSIIYTADRNTADRTIALILTFEGKIFCMEKTMSTYRQVTSLGASNINSLYLNKNAFLIHFKYITALNEYSVNTYGKTCLSQRIIDSHIVGSFITYLNNRNKENKEIFHELYCYRKYCHLYYIAFAFMVVSKRKIKNTIKNVLNLLRIAY